MALLVQRVSGSHRKHYFFPDIAGVGAVVQHLCLETGMDPKAGMIRLVFGLGTRAVNRVGKRLSPHRRLGRPTNKAHSG
jgi:hypothetical protein